MLSGELLPVLPASPDKLMKREQYYDHRRWHLVQSCAFLIAVLSDLKSVSGSEPEQPNAGFSEEQASSSSLSTVSRDQPLVRGIARLEFGPSPRSPDTIRRRQRTGEDPSKWRLELRTIAVLNNAVHYWKLAELASSEAAKRRAKATKRALSGYFHPPSPLTHILRGEEMIPGVHMQDWWDNRFHPRWPPPGADPAVRLHPPATEPSAGSLHMTELSLSDGGSGRTPRRRRHSYPGAVASSTAQRAGRLYSKSPAEW